MSEIFGIESVRVESPDGVVDTATGEDTVSDKRTITINSETSKAEAHREIDRLWNEHKYVELHWNEGKQRTLTQNRALHLWFQWLAESLNDAGFDMRQTIREDLEIPWTPASVKEYLWKPVQNAMLQKESTTEANRIEYTTIRDVIARHLHTRLGVECPPWPKRGEEE